MLRSIVKKIPAQYINSIRTFSAASIPAPETNPPVLYAGVSNMCVAFIPD